MRSSDYALRARVAALLLSAAATGLSSAIAGSTLLSLALLIWTVAQIVVLLELRRRAAAGLRLR